MAFEIDLCAPPDGPLLGVFMPTHNAGFSMSTYPRAATWDWAMNRRIAEHADAAGYDFALAPARWTTLGGQIDFQGPTFEAVTFISAVAAVTERLMLIPTVHTRVFHPMMAAKMLVDLNRISGGRVGMNLVSGWVDSDFDLFDIEPWDGETRLAYNQEWLDVLQLAVSERDFTHEGRYFRVRHGYLEPKLTSPPTIVKAGGSPESRHLVVQQADWLFTGVARDSLESLRAQVEELKARAAEVGRSVRVLSYVFVIARDSEREAQQVRDEIVAHGDYEAARNMATGAARNMARQRPAVVPEIPREALSLTVLSVGARPLVGTPAQVVEGIRELLATGLDGLLFTFYDFERDLMRFSDEVLPQIREVPAQRVPSR